MSCAQLLTVSRGAMGRPGAGVLAGCSRPCVSAWGASLLLAGASVTCRSHCWPAGFPALLQPGLFLFLLLGSLPGSHFPLSPLGQSEARASTLR